MIRRVLDSFQNVITGLGTSRAHTAGQQVRARRILSFQELDIMQQSRFIRRLVHGLPDAAATKPTIKSLSPALDAAALLDGLSALGAQPALLDCDQLAHMYGGAAIWMIFEHDAADTSKPVDLKAEGKLTRLVVLDRWELSPISTGESKTLLIDDPSDPDFLNPGAYIYTPQPGVIPKSNNRIIHASRLIRLYGDPVPPRLRPNYSWWGAPVLEGLLEEVEANNFSNQGGANLLYEFGGKKLKLDNLTELLAAKDGQARITKYLATQQAAFSMLRAWLVGPGYDVEPITTNVSGWSDIKDRLDQQLAAAAGQPITLLYGQAPGGLSTDDQAGRKTFSARVARHQEDRLIPAYDRLITTYLASHGEDSTVQWEVTLAPYEPETEGEEGKRLLDMGNGLKTLLDAKIITVPEARATLNAAAFSFVQLSDKPIDALLSQGAATDPAGNPAAAPPATPSNPAPQGEQVGSEATHAQVEDAAAEGFVEPDEDDDVPQDALERVTRMLRHDALTDTVIPPLSVAANARRALAVRKEKPPSQRGMTPKGIARAAQLSTRRPVSMKTIARMVAYFERHEIDKQGETWDEQGKGWQAWQGWGGDEGWSWAKGVLAQAERAEKGDATVRRLDPYSPADLPALPPAVRELPAGKRARWIAVFNDVWRQTDGDEGRAFAAAWSAVG